MIRACPTEGESYRALQGLRWARSGPVWQVSQAFQLGMEVMESWQQVLRVGRMQRAKAKHQARPGQNTSHELSLKA